MDELVEEDRFVLIGGSVTDARAGFAEHVRTGLAQHPKVLSARFLYDELGSQLFEEICSQPEYYPTRTEAGILARSAGEIVERMAACTQEPPELVELGSGSAEKTRTLLRAFLDAHGRLVFVPVDIAREMLTESSRALIEDFDGLDVHAIQGEYLAGLRELARRDPSPRLVLWLGSSIGNLTRSEAAFFLGEVREVLAPHDRFLIGIDHRKAKDVLEAAYDDARGVTAAFNLNLLTRINRELGGHFDLEQFEHRAVYLEDEGRIEMHLVARSAHSVRVDAVDLDVAFDAGESIHTESSYKYSREEIQTLAASAGYTVDAMWADDEDRFSLNLFAPK